MRTLIRTLLSIAFIAPSPAFAQGGGPAEPSSIVGAWTLNKDLSDAATQPAPGDDQARRGRGVSGGVGGRGGSGGGFPGGGLGRGARGNPEDARRRIDAVRSIMEAPERLTITQTDSLVIITTGDGRTTRLSPNGQKIKDESTGIERKSKWDGATLTTEITGAGPGTITESYAVESGRLTVALQMESSRRPNGGAVHRVYDRSQ